MVQFLLEIVILVLAYIDRAPWSFSFAFFTVNQYPVEFNHIKDAFKGYSSPCNGLFEAKMMVFIRIDLRQ